MSSKCLLLMSGTFMPRVLFPKLAVPPHVRNWQTPRVVESVTRSHAVICADVDANANQASTTIGFRCCAAATVK